MALLCLISELFLAGVFVIIGLFIHWLNTDKDELEGAILTFSFILVMFFSVLTLSIYQFYANILAVNTNRGISALLYQKMMKLSHIGLAKVSTGKLVSLVSGELQTLEKSMWYIPYMAVSPIINILCYVFFSLYYFEAAAIAFVFQLVVVIVFIIISLKVAGWRYLEGKSLKTKFYR